MSSSPASIETTATEAERATRAGEAPSEPVTVRDAVEAFLSRADLSPRSVRAYRYTLERLLDECPPDAWPAEAELERAAVELWGALKPASWNRNTMTVGAFLRWAHRHRLAPRLEPALDRRREPRAPARAIPYAQLDRLWRRDSIPLREKTLWRLLYETAARASEILALNVEDLDQPAKRARIRAKGGDLATVHYASGAAQLLPRLIAGRRHGPIFLTDRAAPVGTPSLDICPETRHARLSYRRAAAIFSAHSDGWTLHQLRHSAITHYAEQGVSTPLLMAKSRHRSLRTLQRYAQPSAAAVAAVTALHDPARRSR